MKNFALLDENNKVINISIADENWDSSGWIEYFETNPASIGYTYDQDKNAFIPPKPFESWTLNENIFIWEPPISYPRDGKIYYWSEEILNWIELNNG